MRFETMIRFVLHICSPLFIITYLCKSHCLTWWGKIKGTPWTKSAIKFFSSVVWTWFTVRFDANRWTVLAHFEWSSSDFFSQKYFGLTTDSTFWLTDSLEGSSKIWEFSMLLFDKIEKLSFSCDQILLGSRVIL